MDQGAAMSQLPLWGGKWVLHAQKVGRDKDAANPTCRRNGLSQERAHRISPTCSGTASTEWAFLRKQARMGCFLEVDRS